MALAIILENHEGVPYWEDPEAILFGLVDSLGWEVLFFKDMEILTFLEYCAQGNSANRYGAYYADRISRIASKYPLIVRAKDYYRDAFFSREEIPALVKELESLRSLVGESQSAIFVNQLLEASNLALTTGAGLRLSAD